MNSVGETRREFLSNDHDLPGFRLKPPGYLQSFPHVKINPNTCSSCRGCPPVGSYVQGVIAQINKGDTWKPICWGVADDHHQVELETGVLLLYNPFSAD